MTPAQVVKLRHEEATKAEAMAEADVQKIDNKHAEFESTKKALEEAHEKGHNARFNQLLQLKQSHQKGVSKRAEKRRATFKGVIKSLESARKAWTAASATKLDALLTIK